MRAVGEKRSQPLAGLGGLGIRGETRLMTLVLGWQAELFAEGGAGVEETEVLSMGESDLLSSLIRATRLPAVEGSAEATAYSTDMNSGRN